MADGVMLRISDGTPLNARVEIDPCGLVVHSRSGTDRNRDYRLAVLQLIETLDAAGVRYDFHLDSSPVRDTPLEARRLTVQRCGTLDERFNALVRAMNAGSASNGAWRRILIRADGYDGQALAAAVSAGTQPQLLRLPVEQLRRVTADHIDRAVARLGAGETVARFAPSRDFDLVAPDGRLLAPKQVFGLALAEATGIDAGPEHFTAGLGTPCFRMLEAAGYPIVPKGAAPPAAEADAVDPDLAAAEGHPRLVRHLRRERKPFLCEAKRRAMVAEFGHLRCERCLVVPSETLGSHGDAVIEVHHGTRALSDMRPGDVTRLSDLVCLCANCHRIVHREMAVSGI